MKHGIPAIFVALTILSAGMGGAGATEPRAVAAANPVRDIEMRAALDKTTAAATALKVRAETIEAYDQMLAPGNKAGNDTVEAVIDGLVGQAPVIERVVMALKLKPIRLEGSDSLDNPAAVFQ